MKRCLSVWIWFAVLLLPAVALAQCPTQETVVLYLNGIDTTRDSAKASKKRIKEEISKVPSVLKDCVSFGYLYNENEPLFLDFLQAGLQKMEEQGLGDTSNFWRWFFRVSPFTSGFADLLVDFYADSNTLADLGLFVLGDQVDEHLVRIREYLAQGKRVILVSHSQGNLYANEEWDQLTEEEKSQVDIVAVATPANYVAKNNDLYTTLTEDWIATLFPHALAANASNQEDCGDDWTCHGFKESYMKGGNSRERIVEEIVALLPTKESEHCRIEGTVRSWDGTIISGGQVLLINYVLGNPPIETTSDATGHYCINVADGDYYIGAYQDGTLLGCNIDVLLQSEFSEQLIIDFPPKVCPM